MSSIQAIHSEWGLSEAVIDHFVREEITPASLCVLEDKVIDHLIPKKGPNAIFRSKLAPYKIQQAGQASQQEPQAKRRKTTSELPLNTREQIHSAPDVNDLLKHLKSSVQGTVVLSYYVVHKKLDDNCRDVLAQEVIHRELADDYDKTFERDDYSKLADNILQLFPPESKETWFDIVEVENKTVISGRLRFKFYSVRRNLINASLVARKKNQHVVNEESGDSESEVFSSDDPDFVWLKENFKPWSEVQQKWTASREIRFTFRKQCPHNKDYIKTFPALSEPLGWELVVYDAETEIPELRSSFVDKWEKFSKFLTHSLELTFPVDVSSDELFVRLLLKVPYLFKVRTLPKSPEAPKSGKCFRASQTEIDHSFCIHVTAIAKIEEILKEQKETLDRYHYPMQPLPVLLGPLSNIRQSFVVLEDKRWELDEPFTAFIATFKIFFGLNTGYPVASRHLWLFLQKTLFGFSSDKDYTGDRGLRSFISARLKEFDQYEVPPL